MNILLIDNPVNRYQVYSTGAAREKAAETITEQAFEQVFKEHFKSLHAYACTLVKSEALAEEIVQNVFFKLWNKRQKLQIDSSLRAYLYKAVYHDSLNQLKHRKIRLAHQQYVRQHADTAGEPATPLRLQQLQSRLDQALNELPEQCRTIFQMSRFEELKYREIAERLGISVKTVENQMGKALRLLRAGLADYLPALLITFLLLGKK